MNLYRLICSRPYVNYISFPSILQSQIKSPLINKPKIESKNEDPVAVDPYNLAILRLTNSLKAAAAAAESGSLYDRRIIQRIENLFSELADVGEMKRFYTALREKGIEIPSSSCQILIKSLIKEGGLDTASEICRECIPKPWFSDFFKFDGCLTINTLLGSLLYDSLSEFEIFVQMLENQGLQPNIYFYKTMIHKLRLKWRYAEAMELFKKLSAKGMKFDSDTYNDLFNGETNLDTIKMLYNDAQEKNVEFFEDCYETLIKVLSENGDFDTVLSVYEKYKLKKHPKQTLSELCSNSIYMLCKELKLDEATAVFQWMVSEGMFPQEYSLQHLIEMYCERDNYVEEVKWTFRKIQEKGLYTDDYCDSVVLELISRVGDSETAWEAEEFLKTEEILQHYSGPQETKKKRMILNSFLGVPNVKETVHRTS